MTGKHLRIVVIIVLLTVSLSVQLADTGQAAEGPFTVAMLTWRGDTQAESGFVEGLNESGYTIRFVKYPVNLDFVRLQAAISSLQREPVDLIYVFGTTASKHVLAEVKNTPVVFNIVTRPIEAGIIGGWESSGNNATGVSSMVPIRHQLETLRKILHFSRLGIVYNPLEQNSIIQRDITAELAAEMHFSLREFKLSAQADITQLLRNVGARVDAVFLPSDSMVKTLGREIMTILNAQHIPTLSAIEDIVEKDAALIGLVPDYYQLGRLAARKAQRILEGERPSAIPSSTLDHFHIIVNMKTAKQIGINIPTSILVMADQTIR
ncbi:MAG: ABC transporter substrate-binding protein [Desulfopila sp.]